MPDVSSPQSKYVTLISNDGREFVVLREATYVSPPIKAMLNPEGKFAESQIARCSLHEISGIVLEKIVEYFHYWYKNRGREDVPDMDIPVEICLELLVAADFLKLDSKEFEPHPSRI
ncbi:Skp1 family protein [Hypomontagnella submonticulosa]|nr:Skp1 family protein [Hypomontagnella submonticulosa]